MALWTPANLETTLPALWLDAADSSTITLSSGNIIEWADKSGNGNHAAAEGPNFFTVLPAEINGLDVVRCPGNRSALRWPTPVAFVAKVIVVIWRWRTPNTTYEHPWDSAGDYHGGSSGAANSAVFGNIGGKYGWNSSLRRSGTLVGTTGANLLRSTTTQQFSLTIATTPIANFIGLGHEAASLGVRCPSVDYCEVLAFETTPTEEEFFLLEGYLHWKWGIQANIDPGHVYVAAAPEVAGGPVTNTVSGTLAVDSTPANRNVLALNSATPFSVLAAATTPAGLFSFNFGESSATVLLAALDNYGRPFEPEYEYLAGDLILPIPYTGYVYEITTPGTSGAAAPNWSTVVGGTTAVGTAVATTRISYKSLAHGPVTPISSGVPEEPVDEYFESVSLLLHMDGINGSTSFEDSSLNGYIITVAGAAQISTVSPKFGTGNLVAAPQSAYIQTPADPFNFGTDDLTIEFQFRGTKAAQTGQPYIMATGAYNASVGFYSIASATTGSISWSVSSGVTSRPAGIATTTDCLDGEWHHIAFVRQGNTMMIFADGALEGSVTAAGPFVLNANTRARIGFEWGSPQGAVCQFDELRVTKGVARYTESFTPPDAPFPDVGPPVPVDENFANVSLLLHMDGADGSTTFTDSSSNALTVTAVGDAQIDTSQSKFGGASGLLDGTGDYLQLPNVSAMDLGAGDFTVEGFVRPAASGASQIILAYNYYSSGDPGFAFYRNGTSQLALFRNGSAIAAGGTVAQGAWSHVALVRSSGTAYLYLDGVLADSAAMSGTFTANDNMRIGASKFNAAGAIGTFFNGHIDEFRITPGIARYTAAFTPPTAPFPDTGP
jgi:hypothetical protein